MHFAANYWRFRPIDFKERSKWGSISAGTGLRRLADHLRGARAVLHEGRLGDRRVRRARARSIRRARGRIPLPPLPNKSSGVLLERGAHSARPARAGRADGDPLAAVRRSLGMYGMRALRRTTAASSARSRRSLVDRDPESRCDGPMRGPHRVHRLPRRDERKGRATGVVYWDREGKERRQPARAVVLAANGAETARLLLCRRRRRFRMGSRIRVATWGATSCSTATRTRSAGSSIRSTSTRARSRPHRSRLLRCRPEARLLRRRRHRCALSVQSDRASRVDMSAARTCPRGAASTSARLRDYYTHSVRFTSHITSLPVAATPSRSIAEHPDRCGRPGLCLTYQDHPDDMKTKQWFRRRRDELMEAAGATQDLGSASPPERRRRAPPRHRADGERSRATPSSTATIARTTCRTSSSATASSFVTSGRGQPTMTIQALAFRAADHITRSRARTRSSEIAGLSSWTPRDPDHRDRVGLAVGLRSCACFGAGQIHCTST